MNKIKVGAKVVYQNNTTEILKVVEKIKGKKTNKPVYHSGILLTGYISKPCKYKLSDGNIVSSNKLKLIK